MLTTHRETVPTTQATQQTRYSPTTHVMEKATVKQIVSIVVCNQKIYNNYYSTEEIILLTKNIT